MRILEIYADKDGVERRLYTEAEGHTWQMFSDAVFVPVRDRFLQM